MPARLEVSVLTLFAPWDPVEETFLAFVSSAQKSIDVNIYGFTLAPLIDILIAKHQAGVAVSLVLDHSQAEGRAEQAQIDRLLAAGVPLLIGTSPAHGAILHAKFCVVDGLHVQHGSWNYSASASSQLNDAHFYHNAPGYAADYLRIHDQVRAFVLLHDAMYQPKGEVAASAALPGDDDPAAVALPSLDPDANPTTASGEVASAATTRKRRGRAPVAPAAPAADDPAA